MINKYLFILVLFASCGSPQNKGLMQLSELQPWEVQIWPDTVWHYNPSGCKGITYEGDWVKDAEDNYPDYGMISDKNVDDSKIVIKIWCWGFDFYTYVDSHHGSYMISIDGVETYVDITNPDREVRKTFSKEFMTYANHEIIITPQPDSTFVFEKFIKWVDSNPHPPEPPEIEPCDCKDTIIYVPEPYPVFVYDTTYIDRYYILKPILYDTIEIK